MTATALTLASSPARAQAPFDVFYVAVGSQDYAPVPPADRRRGVNAALVHWDSRASRTSDVRLLARSARAFVALSPRAARDGITGRGGTHAVRCRRSDARVEHRTPVALEESADLVAATGIRCDCATRRRSAREADQAETNAAWQRAPAT
jgi:hypothetical protein